MRSLELLSSTTGAGNDMDIQQGANAGLRELALFAGAGGGILSGQLLGWRTVCAVERDAYAAQVLAQRQNDGTFEPFPIWSDVTTFDGKPWRGVVDVVSGGFPCQDISLAGKGAGITGEKSGMWSHMARIIGEVRPRFAFVENSPALITRGLGVVLGDLAALGYDCKWGVLGASDVGANHQRDRFWLVANASSRRLSESGGGEMEQQGRTEVVSASAKVANANSAQCEGNECAKRIGAKHSDIGSASWWQSEPDVDRVVDGVAFRSYRLKAIGNGQVPLCAATAFRMLTRRI